MTKESVSSTPESDPSPTLHDNPPVLLLVGGLGTRLRSVLSGAPKPLVKLGGGSFLELLVRQLRFQAFRRLIMCTGYLAAEIEREFGDGSDWGIEIEYSTESRPLGTGGAVKLADNHLQGAPEFLVMNGDSFVQIDFHQLLAIHRKHRGCVTLASRKVENASRYGLLRVESDGRVRSFEEKSSHGEPGLVNAGVYVFNRGVLDHIPNGPASLEKDVFPSLLSQGVYSVVQGGIFIDIGTPEDYQRAQQLCDHLYSAISPRKNSEAPYPSEPMEQ